MEYSNLKYAPQMFRHLNGGHFICASARSDEQKKWYEALEAGREAYEEAWKATTGFELAHGDGYYYFRRGVNGDRRSFEKIASDYKQYCIIVDLLYTLDQSFQVGKTITKSWALNSLDANPAAQEMCKRIYSGTTRNEWADALLKQLEDLEIVDRYMSEEQYELYYPVTEAFDYYRTFIETIKFISPEEEESVNNLDEEVPNLFDTQEETTEQ